MAQLPPKIPPQMTSNRPIFPVHQNNNNQTSGGLLPPPPTLSYMAAPTSTSTSNQHHHNIPNPNLSWVDEFLGFTSTRRGHHRRSISDGVTFIETAGSFAQFGDHQDRQVHDHNNSFDRLDDDDQLILSMFNDDMSLDMPPAFTSNTAMSSPLSTPSEQNSNNEDQVKPCQLSENLLQLQETMHQPQSLREVDGSNKLSMESLGLQSSTDGSCKADPKRVKRILANRQSAQRSRVRKLQYISELERTVTQLQSEVSALSPSVAFLDHQRLELNVNNSALKQRIAALAQDKLFKDAHQEALKREIERLRQIYLQQTLNNDQKIGEDNSNNYNSSSKMINNNNIGTARPIQLSTPDMSITCNDK